VLYLGEDNTLYFPNAAMTINACRSYFQLNGIEAGNLPATNVRLFFGDDGSAGVSPATGSAGITTTNYTNYTNSDEWFTLDGRKIVNSQSSNRKLPKGVYINNGRKTVIK
jgi:hypothetical protein